MYYFLNVESNPQTEGFIQLIRGIPGFKESQTPDRADIYFRFGPAKYPGQSPPKGLKWLSRLSGHSYQILTNKHLFYKRFAAWHFIPKSVAISAETIRNDKREWASPRIVKPSEGFGGSGIRVVQSPAEARAWLRSNPQFKTWTLQKYIEPLLVGDASGYKFHMRIWVLVLARGKPTRVFVSTRNRLVLAALPYQHSDFHNELIHDTHLKRNPEKCLYYPDVLGSEIPWESIQHTLKSIFNPERQFKPDFGARTGYDILGVDMLFGTRGEPYVLEINNKIAYDKSFLCLFPDVLNIVFGLEQPVKHFVEI